MRRFLSVSALLLMGATLALLVSDLRTDDEIEREIANLRAYVAEYELELDDDDDFEFFEDEDVRHERVSPLDLYEFYDIPTPSLN